MRKFVASMFTVGFVALVTQEGLAESSVIINNVHYTCTNTCNVMNRPGGFSVVDCCGGRVTIRMLLHSNK